MKLDEAIKMQCALALDTVADLIEAAGATAEISIIVSHPGGEASDAIVIGSHTLDDLAAVTAGMLTARVMTGTVDPDGYHAEPAPSIN